MTTEKRCSEIEEALSSHFRSEDIDRFTKDFFRYLQTSDELYETYTTLGDELGSFMNACTGVELHYAAGRFADFAKQFDDLREKLKEILQAVSGMVEQVEELKAHRN